MAFPRIPRRWRLRTLMIVVALSAAGLAAYRAYIDRGLFYQILRLRAGPASARVDAALGLGLMGPRARPAVPALTAALDDPDPSVRVQATYALVRLGSRSSRLLPVLVAGIEHTPKPAPGYHPRSPVTWMFDDPPRGWPLSDGGLYDNDPIQALKMIRPPAALMVPMLGKALKDPNDWVRRAAREALFAVANWSDPSSPELAEALLAVLADYRFDPRHQNIAGYDQFANRKQAVEALAKLDGAVQEKAVAQLAADLRDVGSSRSYEASWLLPQLANGMDAAVAVLRDQIRDGDEIKRAIALIMLEPIGQPAAPAAPTLMHVIARRGSDRRIHLDRRMSRWESLGGREGGEAFRRRFVRGTNRLEASPVELCVLALSAMGEAVERRAIRELIAILHEPGGDDDRKRGAIVALGEFGPGASGAIPAIAGVIHEGERTHRGPSWGPDHEASPGALATAALGKIGSEGSPEALAVLAGLIEILGAPFGPDAATALFKLGPKAKPAVPALAKALKDPRQSVRFWSSEALGKIGGPDVRAVMPALIAALDDEDRFVRTHAAEALAVYGAEAKAAVPKMVRLLWEYGPDFKVAISLGRIGPDAAIAVPPLLVFLDVTEPSGRDEIRQAIDRIIPRPQGATIAGSMAAMKASDPAARFRAVYELGRLIEEPPHPADAVAALAEGLGDPDPLVRRTSAAMLCRLGPRAAPAGPALIRAARDPDESVRKLITVALGRAAEIPGAIPALTEMLKDGSGDVRRWAAGALGWAGPRAGSAAPALIAGLEGQDIPCRASILAAMGRLVPWHEAVVPVLLKALDDPAEEVRKAAVNALGEHVNSRRDVVMPALLKAMNEPSWDVRLQVSWRLGMIRPPQVVLPMLIEKLKEDEPNTRKAAAGALWELCDATDRDPEVARIAVEALAGALADRDPEVRSGAAWALMRFAADARPAEPALRSAVNDPDRRVRDNASAALRAIAESRERR